MLPGYNGRASPDDHSLEIEVSKDQSLNDIFSQLSASGIEVLSMRNKTNRLEELFMRLVNQKEAAPWHKAVRHPQPWLLSVKEPRAVENATSSVSTTIVIREFSRIIRIWGQTIVPPAITATLYFLIFGSLIGGRIGDMGGYTTFSTSRPA